MIKTNCLLSLFENSTKHANICSIYDSLKRKDYARTQVILNNRNETGNVWDLLFIYIKI